MNMDERIRFDMDPDQVHALAYIVASDAWTQSFEPFLRGMERGAINDWLDPSNERRVEKPDEYLRTLVVLIRAFLAFPEHILEQYEREQQAAQDAQRVEEHYEERVSSGRYGSFGGANPDEDNAL
jgi:hypothetical protein